MNNNITDYEKIQDDIYWMSLGSVLRFSVTLARKNEDKTRRFFYREVEYDSKYIDKRRVTSVKRSYDYYLSFEISKQPDAFVMIRVQDIMRLRMSLNNVVKWFSEIFATDGKKLVIKGSLRTEILANLPMNRYLKFEPVVIRYDDSQVPGVRMYLSSDALYTDISVDKFMGLVYHINTIDMHSVALAMINSLGPVPYGTNIYSMNTGDSETVVGTGVSTTKPRTLPTKNNNKSFFDNIQELGG